MKKIQIALTLVCVVIAFSCSKDEWIRNPEGLEAEITLAAGQCGATKLIKIDQESTRKSVPKNSCVAEQAESKRATDAAVFQKLNHFVKTLNLQKKPIQDCWRCVDGADYLITLRNGSSSIEHSISLNTEAKGHKEFIEFLESL